MKKECKNCGKCKNSEKKLDEVFIQMSEKKYVIRYQTVITADNFWDAVDKSEQYTDLELYEVKEIFLRGDADEK